LAVVIIRTLASPVAVNIIAARPYPERVDGVGVTWSKKHSSHVRVVLPKDRRRAERAARRGVSEFIEVPSQSAGPIAPVAPSSSGMMRRASCLHRSPPPSRDPMC
jgi:hypothetical protein